jgi:hypothetical protein
LSEGNLSATETRCDVVLGAAAAAKMCTCRATFCDSADELATLGEGSFEELLAASSTPTGW